MKLGCTLWTFAAWLGLVAVFGQAGSVLGSTGGLNNAGGAAEGLGGAGDTANPTKVTGQLNGLLGGLGLNNLDLSHVLTINWDNDKDLLNLLGPEDQGKINVLAGGTKDRNATDKEKADYIRKTESGKEMKKAQEDHKSGKLNFFYAYGMQAVKDGVQPKWTLIFDNAFTASSYFSLIQDTYKEYYSRNRNQCSPRPSPQVFIFPHGVGPDQLEVTKKFDKFTGKVFFQPIQNAAQLPVIPHQDSYGYLSARKTS